MLAQEVTLRGTGGHTLGLLRQLPEVAGVSEVDMDVSYGPVFRVSGCSVPSWQVLCAQLTVRHPGDRLYM